MIERAPACSRVRINFPTNGRRDPLKNRGSRSEVRESQRQDCAMPGQRHRASALHLAALQGVEEVGPLLHQYLPLREVAGAIVGALNVVFLHVRKLGL